MCIRDRLASADQEKIAHIKKDVAIWNINSFAESYLQIEEKYKKNYASAMARFREVREKMRAELEQVKGLRVLPSQANYFMCELTGEITAQELCVRLLHENLLIKDLSAKVKDGKQFIRLAAVSYTHLNDDRLLSAGRKSDGVRQRRQRCR